MRRVLFVGLLAVAVATPTFAQRSRSDEQRKEHRGGSRGGYTGGRAAPRPSTPSRTSATPSFSGARSRKSSQAGRSFSPSTRSSTPSVRRSEVASRPSVARPSTPATRLSTANVRPTTPITRPKVNRPSTPPVQATSPTSRPSIGTGLVARSTSPSTRPQIGRPTPRSGIVPRTASSDIARPSIPGVDRPGVRPGVARLDNSISGINRPAERPGFTRPSIRPDRPDGSRQGYDRRETRPTIDRQGPRPPIDSQRGAVANLASNYPPWNRDRDRGDRDRWDNNRWDGDRNRWDGNRWDRDRRDNDHWRDRDRWTNDRWDRDHSRDRDWWRQNWRREHWRFGRWSDGQWYGHYHDYHRNWLHGWWRWNYQPWFWVSPGWGGWWSSPNETFVYDNPYYINTTTVVAPYDYSVPIPPPPDVVDASATLDPVAEEAMVVFNLARDAFKLRDYATALARVDDAITKLPSDATFHEFRALTLFAMHRYQEAAATIYSVLAVGPGWTWETVSELYSDPSEYTANLRDLEAYVGLTPDQPAPRFLLAYHYLVIGNQQAAADQLRTVTTLSHEDKVAEELYKALRTPASATDI